MKRHIFGFALFFAAISTLMAGGIVSPIAVCAAAIMCANEFIGLCRAKGIRPSPRIIRGMIVAFFVVAALPRFPGWDIPNTWSVEHYPLLLTTGICISFFRLLFRNEEPPATISDIAATVLGFIYVGWLPSHLVLLRNVVPPGMTEPLNPLQQPGLAYVWACLWIVFATDVFAYYIGKYFGKHLLYPQVSPKKTVEGALGGLLAAMFWATFVFYFGDILFPNHPFEGKLWQGPIMGAFVSLGSQLGDLCESLLKRDAGVKDSGSTIPGHGGFLDRGDGLLFGGAISYYWVCLFLLGIL